MSTPPVKYHISAKGNPARCKAKIRCPHGDDAPHFATKEKAQAYIEEQEARKAQEAGGALGTVKKSATKKSPAKERTPEVPTTPKRDSLRQEDHQRIARYIQRQNVWAGTSSFKKMEGLRDSLVQGHQIARHLEEGWGRKMEVHNEGQDLRVAIPESRLVASVRAYTSGVRLTVHDAKLPYQGQEEKSWDLPPHATPASVKKVLEEYTTGLGKAASPAGTSSQDAPQEVKETLAKLKRGPQPKTFEVEKARTSIPYALCTSCGAIDDEAQEGMSSCCHEPTRLQVATTFHSYGFSSVEEAHTFVEENRMPNTTITMRPGALPQVIFCPDLNDPANRRGA